MAKHFKVVRMHKDGVDTPAFAGTKAEYNQLRLQGWSEKKPAGRQETSQTGSTAKSDSKK